MKDAKDVKSLLEKIENEIDVVNVVNVWSNGKKIRRYVGQGDGSTWHNPKDGYKKMVAILVEVEE